MVYWLLMGVKPYHYWAADVASVSMRPLKTGGFPNGSTVAGRRVRVVFVSDTAKCGRALRQEKAAMRARKLVVSAHNMAGFLNVAVILLGSNSLNDLEWHNLAWPPTTANRTRIFRQVESGRRRMVLETLLPVCEERTPCMAASRDNRLSRTSRLGLDL